MIQQITLNFHLQLESIQYSFAQAIIGAIIRTYKENIHQELDLESRQQRQWYMKFLYFPKM